MLGVKISNQFLRKIISFSFVILAFVLVAFSITTPVHASLSKPVSSSISFTNNVMDIPAGMSMPVSVSSTFSGTVNIKSPGGNTKSISFSGVSGAYSTSIALGEVGTYQISESYSVKIVGSSMLGNQESTQSGSNTWIYDNTIPSSGKFSASSSVTGISVGQINGPITVSLAGNSLPTSATIKTTAKIAKGDSISANLSANWSVNSSITSAPPTGTIEVQTNRASATFSITGPANYSGSGTSWVQTEAPTGEYTVTFNTIPGYTAPPQQKGTLSLGNRLTFNGNYTPLLGTVEVTANLPQATLYGPGEIVYNGSGTSWKSSAALVGEYIISYGDVAGYEKPTSEAKTLSVNGTITFNGQYNKLIPGTIEVQTNINEAAFNITGPGNYNGSGMLWTTAEVTPGSYRITYGNVPGYETPPSETKTLPSGGSISFIGEYKKIVPGMIEVHANLDEANFDIKGPMDYSGNGKDWSQAEVPLGSYTITYKAVPDYNTPPSETKIMTSGGNIIFNAEYKPYIGSIMVRTNMPQATFKLSGEADYSGSGTEWSESNAPVGEYTITFDDIPDYETPPSTTQKLNSGGVIFFNAEYVKIVPGTIEVRTNLELAKYDISGPVNYQGDGSSWVQADVPLGEYTITYKDVPDYDTPVSETKVMLSSGSILFRGEYKIHTGTLVVNTNLDEASFGISGAGSSYNGSGKSWTKTEVPIGMYTITYNDVFNYDKPLSETKEVKHGIETTFTGTYNPAPPKIHGVTVSGSPANINSTLGISVNTDTGCIVTFSIEGITAGVLSELSGNGTYITSFKAPKGFDVKNVPVIVKVKNSLGLEASDSSQKVTIDTLAKILSVALSNENPTVNDPVGIKVTGDPNSFVSFSIKGVVQSQMTEDKNSPGTYLGGFVVSTNMPKGSFPVEIKLMDAVGNIDSNSDAIITIMDEAGTVKVSTNLPEATFVVTQTATNVSNNGSGLLWRWSGADPGEYKVTFGDVPGYITPTSQTGILELGGTLAFNASYVLMSGIIKVRTNLESAKFKITGAGEYNGGGESWTQNDAQPGQYTITYEDLDGYETPSSVTKTLSPGGFITFIGGYKITYGTIKVSTNLEGASFDISGPDNYNGTGKEWEYTQAPIGEYTITYGDVSGYLTPSSKTKTLNGGCTITFGATYESLKATIVVRTNLESAGFTLTGPKPYKYDGGSTYFEVNDALPGEYTIEYDDVAGYQKPLPETKTVLANGSIAFIGGYSEGQPSASPGYVNLRDTLMQNYPNPCNPETWIPYSLADGGEVTITIYDISGRVVRMLELGYKSPGIYLNQEKSAYWDGYNGTGEKVASGIYFYHIKAGKFSAIRRMLVSK
jgi:hypothetical protein